MTSLKLIRTGAQQSRETQQALLEAAADAAAGRRVGYVMAWEDEHGNLHFEVAGRLRANRSAAHSAADRLRSMLVLSMEA